MTYILGINAYHGDSSACLLHNGQLLAAAEEERFRRIKHWAGFPSEAIRYCLEEAGIELAEVEHVAVNRDPSANFLRRVAFNLGHLTSWAFFLDRLKRAKSSLSLADEFTAAFPGQACNAKMHNVEHHMAHLASAFLVSPFAEAVVVSVDGSGDFASGAWGIGCGNDIVVKGRVFVPHSLGIFYQAITQFLGFTHYGDEYKVMGLAPYGEPVLMAQMREIVKLLDDGSYALQSQYFAVNSKGFEYSIVGGEPRIGNLYSQEIARLLGEPRPKDGELTQHHKNIARSAQAMYEQAFFHMLNHIHRQYPMDNLALAGGCAMNSVANGKIYRHTPFKKVYVQAAAGDAGGALGAAYWLWYRLGTAPRGFVMGHAYWGKQFSDDYMRRLLAQRQPDLDVESCTVAAIADSEQLCQQTAAAVAQGAVVGWFQGRMEWGPRALGNRSILADPRRADMRDVLNHKIKRRESFRPFAPSILREAVSDWFEDEDDVPFMMQVFQVRPSQRDKIPAVTHVDGSGRLQTVTRESNPLYYQLIASFAQLSGIPMLLNTSFNENEPVVCRPEEALDCFLRTKMDVLVLGNFFISRERVDAS